MTNQTTRLTQISRSLNAARGGNPELTMSEEEWDRRIRGCYWAKLNVKLIDLLFLLSINEKHHCFNDWVKRRRDGTLL